jgi:hypothetical protein
MTRLPLARDGVAMGSLPALQVTEITGLLGVC